MNNLLNSFSVSFNQVIIIIKVNKIDLNSDVFHFDLIIYNFREFTYRISNIKYIYVLYESLTLLSFFKQGCVINDIVNKEIGQFDSTSNLFPTFRYIR